MKLRGRRGRTWGAIALGVSLLEGSRPRGEEGTVPLALALPQIRVSGGSDRDEHPWPPLLLSEAWLGFGGGVPTSPQGASLAWASVPGQDGQAGG